MPDVYLIWEGLPIWLELKVIKNNAVRLSPQQIAWHTAHSHVGGLSFILVKRLRDGCLFSFEGRDARAVASEGVACDQGFCAQDLESVFEHMRSVGLAHWSGFGSGFGSGRGQ